MAVLAEMLRCGYTNYGCASSIQYKVSSEDTGPTTQILQPKQFHTNCRGSAR